MNPVRPIACALLAALAPATAAAQTPPERTAIDDYVQAPDDAYRYEVASTSTVDGVTTIVVDMVSQNWLASEEVDRTEWRHWLAIAIPEGATARTALLNIGGGNNGRDAPATASDAIVAIARRTGTVAAELGMVPNQPLVFHDDGEARYEDNLIGYAWDQFLATGEARWLPRGPMVKSAVRAMDTVTAVMASAAGGKRRVDRFVVAGASKRGWTAWLVGAMDDRVVALIPVVIDVLNVADSMRHHFAAYGFWAPAIGDYVRHGIMRRFDHPRLAEIYTLVDPVNYSHRLTMPKLVLNAAGDQFFLPDSSQFYWRQLRGENYLRYVPNADHGLGGSDFLDTVVAFHTLIVRGEKPPQFSWRRTEDGGLKLLAIDTPKAMRLWTAHSLAARDFRLELIGPAYTATEVAPGEGGSFSSTYNMQVAESGWNAWFLELEYDVGADAPLKLTTEVVVTPETLPFAGKPSGLPTSITALCTMSNEDAAAALAEAAEENAPVAIADTALRGQRAFLNWAPGDDMYADARAMHGYLRQRGCPAPLLQLESGPEVTLPPVVMEAGEEGGETEQS